MSNSFALSEMSQALEAPEGHVKQNGNSAPTEGAQMAANGWNAQQPEEPTTQDGGADGRGFASSARVYDWDDEYGDVGPENPELELDLFGKPENRGVGLDFSKIKEIEVVQEGPERIEFIKKFSDAGLHPVMAKNVELAGYTYPTPIQQFTIPAILQGKDVVGIAQTGSGKTGAYLIPILSKLMGKAKKWAAKRPNPRTFQPGLDDVKAEPLVLIVVPTRELAVQIFNEARKFCYRTMLRPGVVYGGAHIREQMDSLARGCDVLIGTPGRLKDFVLRPNILTLRRLKYIVIDEADEMLGDDWKDELEPVLAGGEQDEGNVKFCLFSATFPKAARELAMEYLAAFHVRFRVGRAGSTTENIQQNIIEIERSGKRDALISLLQEMPGVRTIIFCNSRHEVDNLDDFLWNSGLPVVSIHRDRTQKDREAAMRSFRSGNGPILIATGVCARGIDVRNVMHVINYDLPSVEHGGIEEYIHRIGRTGRIGHRGVATSFFTDRDDGLGSILARTLLETNQEVPKFLEMYLPEGMTRDTVKFETESDFDPNDLGGAGEVGEGGWGGGNADDTAGQESQDAGGWGCDQSAGDAPATAGNTWGAEDEVALTPAVAAW